MRVALEACGRVGFLRSNRCSLPHESLIERPALLQQGFCFALREDGNKTSYIPTHQSIHAER